MSLFVAIILDMRTKKSKTNGNIKNVYKSVKDIEKYNFEFYSIYE
jgi:hypothetical protein